LDKISAAQKMLSGIGLNYSSHTSATSNHKIAGFDTGGYTKSFGSSGKLAVLHEKELVLNKVDTENILNTVGIVRNIASKIPKISDMRNMSTTHNSNRNNFNIKVEMYGVNNMDDFYKDMNEGMQTWGVKFTR